MNTLAAQDVGPHDLQVLDEAQDKLGPDSRLRDILGLVAHLLRQGTEIVFAEGGQEVTPAVAAGLLGMSRPHLYKLLDEGVLPHHRTGRDRRIRMWDVVDYLRKRDQARCQLAESFAHAERGRQALVARIAGVDVERSQALGH